MIDGSVRVHGLDSPGFAALCSLVAARDRAGRHEIHLLHDGGRTIVAVDTRSGRIADPPAVVTDPIATARALRAAHGAERAVVADAAAVRRALVEVEHTADATAAQPDVLVAFQQAFWTSPGVVADPPSAPSSWPRVAATMQAAGDGAFVLAARGDDGWAIALTGRLQGGRIVEVTDLPADGVSALPDLVRVGAVLGVPVVLSLVTDVATLQAALAAPDVATALLDLVTEPERT